MRVVAVRAAAHLFVADLDAPAIGANDRHHVERVLRLRDGETVTVSDGRGGLRVCRFVAGGIEPVNEPVIEPRRLPPIGVGFALMKGSRPEWIVQKLTECGVDRIVPFTAARSVVRWDEEKAARNVERWRRVALEAAMQSRQRWLPVVESVGPFASVVADSERSALLADPTGRPPSLLSGEPGSSTVLVGPEGGWSDEERAAVDDRRIVRFAPGVLRAETAAVAAGVILTALRDGVVAPADGRAARS